MIRALTAIVAFLLPWTAFAAEPFARASVEDDGKIVPGQQVRIDIDLFTPDFFTSPPQFPLFEMPNALVTLSEGRSENVRQTLDGVDYSGIRKSYAVVPQVSGTFTTPPIAIAFGYSINGAPAKGRVEAPSVSFTVAPSSGDSPIAFAAMNLVIDQTFDRNPQTMKAGDALVRTITLTAGETQAMLMPPLNSGTADGLQQYRKPPKIEDGIANGRDTVSRRTETYVYTADKQGSFRIPAISYPWFDVGSHETKIASLPEIPVTVVAAETGTAIAPIVTDDAPRQSPHAIRQKLSIAIAGLLAIAALFWLARKILPMLAAEIGSARQRHRTSYGYRLKQLRTVIQSGTEPEIYAALQSWSHSLGYRTLADWSARGPATLTTGIANLSQRLFHTGGAEIDRRQLSADAGFRQPAEIARSSPLAPLNPPGPDTA